MLRIRDTYISFKNIMALELEHETMYEWGEELNHFTLIVRYFNDAVVRISIDSRNEYDDIADRICSIMSIEEGR